MESPEYTKFQESYAILSAGITRPEVLAGLLWANKFIGPTERTDAQHIQTPPHHRTIALLDSVGRKILLNPEMFNQFLLILQQDPSLAGLAAMINQPVASSSNSTSRVSTMDYSEEQMKEYFTKLGLKDTDKNLLIAEGFGTGPGFMELTKEDIEEMTFSRAGRKILLKTISPPAQPSPMVTAPPPSLPSPVQANGATAAPFPTFNPAPIEPLTADTLAGEIGLAPYTLDNEFSDNFSIILAFAKIITHWQPLASTLGLSPQDIRGIETNISLNFQMQCTEVLKRWKMRYAFKATYRMLIEAVLSNGWENIGRQYAGLVQRIYGGVPTQAKPPAPTTPSSPVVVPLSLSSLIDVLSSLPLTRSNNGQLSRGLGIPDYKLVEFESNNVHDIARVRNDLLRYWLSQGENLSWQVVGSAVWKAGDTNLARKILNYRVPDN